MKLFASFVLLALALVSPATAADLPSLKLIYGILFDNENHVYSREIACPADLGCNIDEKTVHLTVRFDRNRQGADSKTPETARVELTCDQTNCAFANGKTRFDITDFGKIIETELQKGRPDLGFGIIRYLRVESRTPLATVYIKIVGAP